jgi:protein SCO1/2
MDLRKKINIVFFTALIIIPVTVFGVMRWINNNYSTLPYYGDKEIIKENGKEKEVPFIVPSFSFTNQDGQVLTSDFVKDKIWIADYFFTKCTGICPKLATHLQTVQEAFKNDVDVKIVSFTVDPDRDTPSVLRVYAAGFAAIPSQWQFVTGAKRQLYAFARKGLFIVATDGDGGAGDFIHSENLVLIDQGKHIRGYYDGTSDKEVAQLIKDIQRLKKENKSI